MKKLPLGKQHLEQFVRQNLLYVDKTALIYRLVEDGNYYFLSRPRRFGKSLLVDTLRHENSKNPTIIGLLTELVVIFNF